ncbi:hypothetical protein FR279_22280 [Vibrio vulnificus]|nr:hypothetical protein [Vibrio vulnificus]EGR1504992.1 hypothetical protein [Vibrio parahaemolyticus]EGV2732547.1 hypothetical protein [Vibrio parahaemolyticus]RZQ06510.1 hypothetical protein D8T46_23480 [Vibrio vulnificus]HAS8138116.1 hypothetical protein [Vibrio vulnificus]
MSRLRWSRVCENLRGSLPIRCISSCECIDRKVRGITLTTNITICLRVIRNAWHFYYALV